MQRSSLPVGVSTLKKWKEEKGSLRCTLSYQRSQGIWNNITKSMLIWAILADSYIPPIVLLKDEDGKDDRNKTRYLYEICDGLQRLTTVFSFIDQIEGFRLHNSTPEAEVEGVRYELAGCTFQEMSDECQDRIANYRFSVQCIENYTREEAEMLFFNINSGVALSTIQKSKPKLGEEICSYMSKILEKSFFRQGIHITAAQALREDDFCILLQGMMLLDEQYDSYKSISASECLTYAEQIRLTFEKKQQDLITEIVDYLGVYKVKMKYLRKNNVPIIMLLARQAISDEIESGCFKSFLDEFFEQESEEYKEFSGSGNVKRINVEGRARVLTKSYHKYFSLQGNNATEVSSGELENLENQELSSSSIGSVKEDSENSSYLDEVAENMEREEGKNGE